MLDLTTNLQSKVQSAAVSIDQYACKIRSFCDHHKETVFQAHNYFVFLPPSPSHSLSPSHFPPSSPSSLQKWARAYRDDQYHAAVDTNNGTEAQNKLLKYSFLPRKKYTATLSNIVSILVESFLPTRRQHHILQNYKQSSEY